MAIQVQQSKTVIEDKVEDPKEWNSYVPRTGFKAKLFTESAAINGVNIQPNSMVLMVGDTPVAIPADIFNAFFTTA